MAIPVPTKKGISDQDKFHHVSGPGQLISARAAVVEIAALCELRHADGRSDPTGIR
jgi:hypothetical protein